MFQARRKVCQFRVKNANRVPGIPLNPMVVALCVIIGIIVLLMVSNTIAVTIFSSTQPVTVLRVLSDPLGSRVITDTDVTTPRQGYVYYVAKDGDDDNSGTEDEPFRTINHGVSVLEAGDTLYVKQGTYAELLRYFPTGASWDSPITIAAYPGDTVTLRPSSGNWVLYITRCHHVIVDGFVLDGTSVDHNVIKVSEEAHHIRIQNSEVMGAPKSGVIVTSNGSLDSDYNEFIQLDVHDNGTTDFDHGFYLATDHNLVDQCAIYQNSGWGVHVYNGSSGQSANNNVIRNNKIYNNAGAGDRGPGIILSSGSGHLAYNNLVWGNQGGIQVDFGASGAKVLNNVVYANDIYGVLITRRSINAVVRNNIVYQNSGESISDNGEGTISDHNLGEEDPLFVNSAAYDFHLRPSSPAIDAGITLSEVPFDRDGLNRPRGAGYDIGAYESPYSARVVDLRVTSAYGNPPDVTLTLRWTAPVAAVTYALRSSTQPISADNWEGATNITVPFEVSDPGSEEELITSVTYTGGTLYLALRTQNSFGDWSPVSNNAFWPVNASLYLPMIIKHIVK